MPVVFRFIDPVFGLEPWISDGTVSGTGLVRDTSQGGSLDGGGYDIGYSVGGELLFRVSNDDGAGDGIWVTDGRSATTLPLTTDWGLQLHLTGGLAFGGDYILGRTSLNDGSGVYRVDRGGAVTPLIEGALVSFTPADPDNPRSVDRYEYFDLSPDTMVDLGSTFVFEADIAGNPATPRTVHVSDGTAAGTLSLPAPLSPGSGSFKADVTILPETANGDRVLFTALSDADIETFARKPGQFYAAGPSVWSTDGTVSGSFRLDAIGSFNDTQGIESVQIVGTNFLALVSGEVSDPGGNAAIDTAYHWELWASDGTRAGTRELADLSELYPDEVGSGNGIYVTDQRMSEPVAVGDEVAFVAHIRTYTRETARLSWEDGAELYLTENGGTTLRAPVTLDRIPSDNEMFSFNGDLIFAAPTETSTGLGVYATDPQTGVTRLLMDAALTDTGESEFGLSPPGFQSFYGLAPFFDLGDRLVFVNEINSGGPASTLQFFGTDGTAAGTELLLVTIAPYSATLTPQVINSLVQQDGDKLYIAPAGDLIVTDGTHAGTRPVTGLNGQPTLLGVVAAPIDGTSGNDTLTGTDAGEVISGLAGDDLLNGLGGDDRLEGGDGNDTIFGGDGHDTIYGGFGNDFIGGGAGDDLILGGDGADTIYGGLGDDRIGAGAGNDLIFGVAGSNRIYGGFGADTVQGGTGDDLIFGEGSSNNVLYGNGGDDVITAGSGNDFLAGGTGNDRLFGGAGTNTIYLGLGDDFAGGGAGNDVIYGGAGTNTIYGGLGNDTVQGGSGNDAIYGGGNGANRLLGNGGDDVITAGAGNDFLAGGAGNDTIYGGAGANTIYLGIGDDLVGGGQGDDIIFAGAGNNRIYGGTGNDTIFAGTGRDVTTAGAGADVFVFNSAAQAGIGAGRDVITDFEAGIDRIDLSALNLTFVGNAPFSGTAGELRYIPGFVVGDLDGDGVNDFAIELSGAPALTAGDFIL